MAVKVEMPQLSDTMEKGTIVRWLKEEGDSVERGDVLAEVETDKATMDLEAFDDGVLLKRLYDEGEDAPTQTLIAVLGEEGEDISDILEQADTAEEVSDESESTQEELESVEDTEEPAEDEEATEEEEPKPSFDETPDTSPEETTETVPASESAPMTQTTGASADGRLRVSPVARRIASQNQIDLHQLEGSGPEGRIVKKDVQEAIKEGRARAGTGGGISGVSSPSPLKSEKKQLSGMRKTIAQRMAQSKRQAPHFYLTRDIDMERVTEMRDDLNTGRDDSDLLSYNDFVMLASARALREVPEVNSSYQEDHIQLYDRVDLGFAVAVEEGLFTPVIERAEQRSIDEIHSRSQALIEKAREDNLTPDDYQGGTFTISNLGMFGISHFTAVINPPQAAILAVGAVEEKPVAENGEVTISPRMNVTLSCDHRAIDGVHGSRYLKALARMLERPYRLLA